MTKAALLIALVTALASPVVTDAAAAKRHHRHAVRHTVPAQPQIACTVIGCVPVPPGCGQTGGKTRGGSPTGGDVIVCPPGVAPFRANFVLFESGGIPDALSMSESPRN